MNSRTCSHMKFKTTTTAISSFLHSKSRTKFSTKTHCGRTLKSFSVDSSKNTNGRGRFRKYRKFQKLTAMRTKNLLLILCCVVLTSFLFLILSPTGEPNDSFKSIVTHTHQQLNKFQENLRVAKAKKLDIDPKYLAILGYSQDATNSAQAAAAAAPNASLPPKAQQYTILHKSGQPFQAAEGEPEIEIHHLPLQSSNSISSRIAQGSLTPLRLATPRFNGTKANFSIVTYVQDGQGPSAILLSQNIAAKLPYEQLLIYDLGLSEEESRALSGYCNSTKCSVISYDLSVFPSFVTDQRMHAYRPIVIKDALMRAKSILFTESNVRIQGGTRELHQLLAKVANSGVLCWTTPTAVSARTHPKMFDYFQTDADDFYFMRMVVLDAVFFTDTPRVLEKILLPWIKCALTQECIDPIGAQSNGCKYNKKPLYRYSGCHAYDVSAFNIVLGLTWHLDDTKYSLPEGQAPFFYKETLEQATKILESRRRNSSETPDHTLPFTEE